MSSIILQTQELTKEYKHTQALDHINLQIEKGKIYGFIGKNGAGKTTFFKVGYWFGISNKWYIDFVGKKQGYQSCKSRENVLGV